MLCCCSQTGEQTVSAWAPSHEILAFEMPDSLERFECNETEFFKALYALAWKENPTEEDRKAIRKIKEAVSQRRVDHEPFDSLGLTALTEMGDSTYLGREGGLYPNKSNTMPYEHAEAGKWVSKLVVPRNIKGEPDDSGKIVMLGMGMSNTKIEFKQFIRMSENTGKLNPQLVLINAARGSQTVDLMDCDDAPIWSWLDEHLKEQGLDLLQVQVMYLKNTTWHPTLTFEEEKDRLRVSLHKIMLVAKRKLPNLQICYLSSRTYAGYSIKDNSPEPYAYETGFAVKELVERQIMGDSSLNFDPAKGTVYAPWIAWGPYLWVNGATSEGSLLSYKEDYYRKDEGLHPSHRGAQFTSFRMIEFFIKEPSARDWFWKPR